MTAQRKYRLFQAGFWVGGLLLFINIVQAYQTLHTTPRMIVLYCIGSVLVFGCSLPMQYYREQAKRSLSERVAIETLASTAKERAAAAPAVKPIKKT